MMTNEFFIDNWKNKIKVTEKERNLGILYYLVIHIISFFTMLNLSNGEYNYLQILVVVVNEIIWAELLSDIPVFLSKEKYITRKEVEYKNYIQSFGVSMEPYIRKSFSYQYQYFRMQHRIFSSLISVFVFFCLFSILVNNSDSYIDSLIMLVVSGIFLFLPFAYIKKKLFFSHNLEILKD